MKKTLSILIMLGLILSLSAGMVMAQDPEPVDPVTVDAPPADEPPADVPPADEPPADTPPADEPPADTPPADEPPADTPPADEPPVDEPPAVEEPVIEEPIEEPVFEPVEEPVVEEPVVEEPVVEEPVVEEPVVEEPANVGAEIGAAGATTANYTSMVFIGNTTANASSYAWEFYPVSGTAKIDVAGGSLVGHGSTNLDLANVTQLGSTFEGSAMIRADEPLAAVLMNYTTSGGDFTLTNGYGTGAPLLYAPAVVNKYASGKQTSHIYIQNVSSGPIDVTVDFIDRERSGTGHPNDKTKTKTGLAAGYAWHMDVSASDIFGSTEWVGSARIQATGGDVVATIQTLYGAQEAAFGMESVTGGSNRLCSPTAMWNYSSLKQRSYMAVQNPDTAAIAVDLKYFDTSNNQIGTTHKATISGQSKLSFTPQTVLSSVDNYIGSATVDVYNATRTGPAEAIATHNIAFRDSTTPASSFDLVACGTAGGSTRQILPALLWDKLDRKGYIAIQNVSSGPINITTTLYNANGTQQGTAKTDTGVQPDIKVNRSLTGDFGVTSNWQGSMVIEGTGNIAVLVTIKTSDGKWLGSYTGIPY